MKGCEEMSFLDGVRKLVNVQTGTTAQQVLGGGEPTSENSVFTKQMRNELVKENAFNLDKKTIKLIEKLPGGEAFLLKISNLQDSDANTPGIQLEQNAKDAIKQEAIKFFKADKDTEVNMGTQALLGKFGVTPEEYAALVNGNVNSNAQTEQPVVTGEQGATELPTQQGSGRLSWGNQAFNSLPEDVRGSIADTLGVSDDNSSTGDVAGRGETTVEPEASQPPSNSVSMQLTEDIATRVEQLGFQVDDGFRALTPEDQAKKLDQFEQEQKQDAEIDAKAQQLGYTPNDAFNELGYAEQKVLLEELEKKLNDEIDELQQNKIADFADTGESPMKDMTLVKKRDYLRDRINGQKDLINNAKQVTVSERGSTQRLTKDDDWTTGVKISSEKLDNGLPARISIQLPDAYGADEPDGKKQVRYQTLHYDAETGCYSDKQKVRQFKLLTSENGITLMQVDAEKASEGVKTFLDKNVTAVQEKIAETVQKAGNSHKMDLQKKTPQQMTILKDLLSSRNSSWQVYTQAGSEVGYPTGAYGLLEEIVDESQVTGVETYNDLSPMIKGLMSRVPKPDSIEVTSRLNSEQREQYTKLYNDAKNLIAEMAQNPEAPLKTGGPSGGIVRDLDEILLPLGQLMAENQLIEGINFANNTYLIGGSGSNIVTITPARDHGMWKTDAEFRFAGDKAVYEMHSGGGGQGGRTVDFQDLVEHEDDGKLDKLSLIRNDITGNNRHGEIKFNAERAQKLTNLRFNDGVNSYPIKVKVNDAGEIVGAFVYSPGGKNKVEIEDLLNGRVKMPQNEPAE